MSLPKNNYKSAMTDQLTYTNHRSFENSHSVIPTLFLQHLSEALPPLLSPPFSLPSTIIYPLLMGERWENDGRTSEGRAKEERRKSEGRAGCVFLKSLDRFLLVKLISLSYKGISIYQELENWRILFALGLHFLIL